MIIFLALIVGFIFGYVVFEVLEKKKQITVYQKELLERADNIFEKHGISK